MVRDTIYKVGIYLRLFRYDESLGQSGSISTQRDILLNYIRVNIVLDNLHKIANIYLDKKSLESILKINDIIKKKKIYISLS